MRYCSVESFLLLRTYHRGLIFFAELSIMSKPSLLLAVHVLVVITAPAISARKL